MSDSYKDFVRSMNRRANDGAYDCPDAIPNLEKRARNGDFDARAMLIMLGQLNFQSPKQKI